jgi:anti-sigma B factor antagonist
MALRHAGVLGFRVDVAREPGGTRVQPVGEIDMASVGYLRERVDEVMAAGAGRVILDLRQTTFLDSAGLHLAVDIAALAERAGTPLAIIPGPPAVHRVFEIAGLTRLPFVEVPAGTSPRAAHDAGAALRVVATPPAGGGYSARWGTPQT